MSNVMKLTGFPITTENGKLIVFSSSDKKNRGIKGRYQGI